ncbi:MAG: methyl-accepting chemotaxis protein [Hyphomonadaceae bacterium]
MSIRGRIFIAFGLVFVCIAVLSGAMVVEAAGKYFRAEHALRRITVAPAVSALVHELQKERGLSAGFVGSSGERFGRRLAEQRETTNAALARFQSLGVELDGEADYEEPLTRGREVLDSLDITRREVSALELTVADVPAYYNPLIAALIEVASGAASGLDDAGLSRASSVYRNVIEAKERAGLERAVGAAGFGAGLFDPSAYAQFVSLGAAQQTYLDAARRDAGPDYRAFEKEIMRGAIIDRVGWMRAAAHENAFGGDTQGISGPEWFDAATARIDLFKALEDHAADRLRRAAGAWARAAWATMLSWSLVALVALAVAVAVVLWVKRSVTSPLHALVEKVRRVADGDLAVDVPEADRRDEIGEMGRALQVFRENAARRDHLENRKKELMLEQDRRRQRMEALLRDFCTHARGSLEKLGAAALRMAEAAPAVRANGAPSAAESWHGVAHKPPHPVDPTGGVPAAIEQFNASIRELAQRAAALDGSSDSIAGVMTFVSEIAEQTNALALNFTFDVAQDAQRPAAPGAEPDLATDAPRV